MSARANRPEASYSSGTVTHNIEAGTARSIAHALPPHIVERLKSEGITTVEDWRRLSRRARRSLWGVVPSTIRILDRLARQA